MTKETVARIKIVLAMTTIGTIGLLAKNIDVFELRQNNQKQRNTGVLRCFFVKY